MAQHTNDREMWLQARKRFLAKEKEFTHMRDQLSAERRALPWLRLDKSYTFEGCEGRKLSLGDLFRSHSQLAVYHLMFGPDWEAACKSCSFWADSFNDMVDHLAARDVSFVAVSRAPKPKLKAFAERMGWTFPWVSSFESDFNFDFNVSFTPEQVERGEGTYNYAPRTHKQTELPGMSAFAKDADGTIFHTYSSFGRGIDMLNPVYQWLDLAPKGRDEAELPSPMAWVKLRDQYVR
jgi:predicted dithiol-disulfide oxidoreductase (DUF899 family)